MAVYGFEPEKVTKKYNTYASAKKVGESNVDYYKRLAKQADKRMRRLEELAEKPGYENVRNYAYRNAKNELKKMNMTNWEQVPKKLQDKTFSARNTQMRINKVKQFLESPTSTKSGIDKVYKSRADTMNERYGTSFTWEDMSKFFESGTYDQLSNNYSSKTKMKAIGVIQKYNLRTTKDLNNAITEASQNNQTVADDEVMRAVRSFVRKGTKSSNAVTRYLDSTNPFED